MKLSARPHLRGQEADRRGGCRCRTGVWGDAYRYFSSQDALLAEAPLQVGLPTVASLFGDAGAPTDVEDRAALVHNVMYDRIRDRGAGSASSSSVRSDRHRSDNRHARRCRAEPRRKLALTANGRSDCWSKPWGIAPEPTPSIPTAAKGQEGNDSSVAVSGR